MMNKNEYDLLRPFDLEAAKRGEPTCWAGEDRLACVHIEWEEPAQEGGTA